MRRFDPSLASAAVKQIARRMPCWTVTERFARRHCPSWQCLGRQRCACHFCRRPVATFAAEEASRR